MADIEIEIEGIIALFFERDSSQPNPTACVVGIVDRVPRHQLEIKFKKNQNDPVSINPASVRNLRLEVENTSTTGIRFFNEQLLDRVTGDVASGGKADPQSASWILEFEGELYPSDIGSIGVLPTGFHPKFRINNGEIFTLARSENHLLTRPENAELSEPFTLVGRVATKVGIRTNLDLSGSKATLFNDFGPVESVVKGETLKIVVALTCPSCSHTGQQTGHANNYYLALGTNLPFGQKKLFSSTKMPPFDVSGPISPEASCLVGQTGTSNPPNG